jgi:glycosyltransferase involved in cell wall biosynthesis
VIATPNTGANDVITEGKEGFIVPVANVESLAEKLRWCADNRDALRAMREPARHLAESLPWDLFRERIRATLHDRFPDEARSDA